MNLTPIKCTINGQMRELMVDPRSHTTVANVGVHRVGEVDDSRAARQGQDLAFGREYVHFVGKQIDLDVFQELGGITGCTLQFKQ